MVYFQSWSVHSNYSKNKICFFTFNSLYPLCCLGALSALYPNMSKTSATEWDKTAGPPCPALRCQVCRVQRKFWTWNLTPHQNLYIWYQIFPSAAGGCNEMGFFTVPSDTHHSVVLWYLLQLCLQLFMGASIVCGISWQPLQHCFSRKSFRCKTAPTQGRESPVHQKSREVNQWNVTHGFTSENRLKQKAVKTQGKVSFFFHLPLRLLVFLLNLQRMR